VRKRRFLQDGEADVTRARRREKIKGGTGKKTRSQVKRLPIDRTSDAGSGTWC